MKYRALPGLRIPMPDRPGQVVPDTAEGTALDEMSPYYARLIADGDVVPVPDALKPSEPDPGAGQGDL